MAVLWKAEYGYCQGYNPSTFVKTDGGLYGFPTQLMLPVDHNNLTYSSYRADFLHTPKTQVGMGDIFVQAMGEEYYKIYCSPNYSGVTEGQYEKYIQCFGSIDKSCPNLWALYGNDNPSDVLCACRIPALNRILIYGNTSPYQISVYNLEGVSIGTVRSNPINLVAQITGFFSVYKGDVSKEGLTTASNYLTVGFILDPAYYVSSIDNTNTDFSNLINYIFGDYSKPDYSDNPYAPGGESGEGGGDGTFDDESDPIEVPSLPTLSSANTGFTRIYNPTLSQVQNLANYLWTDESVIQTIWNHIKQFFENPMDAIIGFNLVPVPVPDGGTENFKLMYIDTGVAMTVAANQFVDVDCGSVKLDSYYGSALDYSPYTKVSCFLPYIGNVSLNVDEVMDRTLAVKYRVDICSGSCVAYLTVDGNALYQYSGHCAIPIPLSSADFSSYVNSAISVGKLAGAALVGGAGAAMSAGAQDATQQTNQVVTTQVTTTKRQPSTGQQIVTGTVTHVQTRESPADQSSTQASFSGLTPQNIANTVGQIMSSKPYIEHSGSFSGNSGYLGVRRPYLVIERPNMCMPADFQQFNGFPCMINLELGSCSGFTRVQQIQLTGLSATNPEQAEIMELLKSGVVL